MSRSGYSDDCDYLGLYRANVDRALRGKSGQAFLREMLTALDALPQKRLVHGELETATGDVCALGSVARLRGMPVGDVDADEPDEVAERFGIRTMLAQEIVYENDERYGPIDGDWNKGIDRSPEARFTRMRAWVASQIVDSPSPETEHRTS